MNRCTYCAKRIWPWQRRGWEVQQLTIINGGMDRWLPEMPVKHWHSTCRRERTG